MFMIICDGLGLENGIYTGEVVMENYNLTTRKFGYGKMGKYILNFGSADYKQD